MKVLVSFVWLTQLTLDKWHDNEQVMIHNRSMTMEEEVQVQEGQGEDDDEEDTMKKVLEQLYMCICVYA